MSMILATDMAQHAAHVKDLEAMLDTPGFAVTPNNKVRAKKTAGFVTDRNLAQFVRRQRPAYSITDLDSRASACFFFLVFLTCSFFPFVFVIVHLCPIALHLWPGARGCQVFLMAQTLHAADISNPARPWDVYQRWNDVISEEFYNQGDRERKMGIPVSFAMDRKNPIPNPKFQADFIRGFVAPLFHALEQIPSFDFSEPVSTLAGNLARWQKGI